MLLTLMKVIKNPQQISFSIRTFHKYKKYVNKNFYSDLMFDSKEKCFFF